MRYNVLNEKYFQRLNARISNTMALLHLRSIGMRF